MRTHRLLTLLIGAFITGNIAGCSDQVAYQAPPTPPPQIEGYDDRYWVWDEEDGEWEYDSPDGRFFFYGGKLHKSSISKTPGFKSASKYSGFGSGTKGGGFGG